MHQSLALCRVSPLIFSIALMDTSQKVILAAMVLEEDHTGEYLASKLNEAI